LGAVKLGAGALGVRMGAGNFELGRGNCLIGGIDASLGFFHGGGGFFAVRLQNGAADGGEFLALGDLVADVNREGVDVAGDLGGYADHVGSANFAVEGD
jgi:hypothetical protein